MRGDADLDDVVECEIEHVSACTTKDQLRRNQLYRAVESLIRTAEAISRRAERRDSLFLKRGDDLVERRASELLRVRREPLHDVEGMAGVQRVRGDRVAVQVVGDIRLRQRRARTLSTIESGHGRLCAHLATVSREVIGKQLYVMQD